MLRLKVKPLSLGSAQKEGQSGDDRAVGLLGRDALPGAPSIGCSGGRPRG